MSGAGELLVRLCQKEENILEAKLVMFHVQGRGVLAIQDIPVTDGVLWEFKIETPDIDADGKFEKPVTSIWFRVALAIRNSDGIYFTALVQRAVDTKTKENGKLFDRRKIHLEPLGDSSVCGVPMTALPYYAGNKSLSMKFVRPEHVYRGQFTNELLDVTIKKDILTVKMRCLDCGVTYKGVLLEYRKLKEDDAQAYLIPYDTLEKEKDLLITDFSSVAWDVYYMNKPVLFDHFDLEVAEKTLGFYMDMRNELFGERAEDVSRLFDLITEYIEREFKMKEKYAKDREKYFAYTDNNNSERIWKAIQESKHL